MTNSPLTKILLPAAMVSSATFAALNAPFFLLSSEPLVIEVPPLFSAQIQPVFLQEHRDFAIRYVGGSIVVSVAAGLITAEVLRNRYRQVAKGDRPSLAMLAQILQQAEATPPKPSALDLEANALALDPDYEAIGLEYAESLQENPPAHAEWVEEPMPEFSRAHLSFVRPEDDAIPLMVLETALEYHTPDIEAIALEKPLSDFDVDGRLEPITELPADIPLERIQLPQHQQTFPALSIEGQYYRLLRAGKTQQQAQRIAAKLRNDGRKVLLTQTASLRGTTIWILEPQACLANHHLRSEP